MMPFEKRKNSLKKSQKTRNFKGIYDNILFLKGDQCNYRSKNDREQAKECDGSANEQCVMMRPRKCKL